MQERQHTTHTQCLAPCAVKHSSGTHLLWQDGKSEGKPAQLQKEIWHVARKWIVSDSCEVLESTLANGYELVVRTYFCVTAVSTLTIRP